MVGHDPIGPEVPAREQDSSGRGDFVRAVVGILAGAIAIGAFFASLAISHQVALEFGLAAPSVSWLRSCRDWLPWLCIGLGLSRLGATHLGGRTALRGLAIGSVFALTLAQAVLDVLLPWLPSAIACLIGLVLGLQNEAARRTRFVGVAIGGAGAAVAAFAITWLPPTVATGSDLAALALAVAMLAALIALVVEAPAASTPHAPMTRPALVITGWLVVVTGVAFAAAQTNVDDWVLFSAFVAIVAFAALAGRLALAFGAAAATVLLTTGILGDTFAAGGTDTEVFASGQELRRCGDAEAVYLRQSQELQLRLAGEVVAAAGPDRMEEPLLTALLHALIYDGDRVLMLGSGTGRTEASVRATNRCQLESAPAWPQLTALQKTVQADGPVLQPADNDPDPAPAWSSGLHQLPGGSRQLLALGELPGAPTAHRATASFQRQLRRIVGAGYTCQPIALDRIGVPLLHDWFRAASAAHPWNGIYAVGNAAVLVSGSQRPSWRPSFRDWSDEARWAMHAAHLGGPSDLDVAFLGSLRVNHASTGAVPDVARLLMGWLTIPTVLPTAITNGTAALAARSEVALLRQWQRQQSDMLRAKGRLLALANTPDGRRDAQAIAARFLAVGAPAPWLQAALGLAGPDGVALRDPGLASRCAFAMDPTFFVAPAPVYATLPLPNQERGDLEDLHRIGEGARLVQLCSGTSPRAVSLRLRFASRCARVLLQELAKGPLADDPALALRELSDSFVLAEAARVLVPAGRWRELLTLWRADLPCPQALVGIAKHSSLADRMRLASALRGRREPSCYPVIAGFLLADELELRKVAGEALRMAVGDRVPFDANWSRSRRLDAATSLRVLHNRKP